MGTIARVLMVQHDATCPPARFYDWLEEADCWLDIHQPYLGDPLPGLSKYAGLVVLGGSMGATDDEACPWLPETRERIREAALLGIPTLGICLGHQLAALALGGAVGRNPNGVRIGVLPVGWGCEVLLDPLVDRIAGEGRAVYWNQDVVTELPPDTQVLATGPDGEVQVARFARTVWGVQFHPEADDAVVATWVAGDTGLLPAAGLTGDTVVSRTTAASVELTSAWRPLARSFARMVKGRAAANGGLWD